MVRCETRCPVRDKERIDGQSTACAATQDRARWHGCEPARQQRQLDTQAKQLAALSDLAKRVDELESSLSDLDGRTSALEKVTTHRDVELERRRAQLGAVEQLGRIDELVAAAELRPRTGIPREQVGEALDLLAEVRREHERIRVRMQIVASYEERLRRVEESLIGLYSGDERHQL